MARLEAAGLFAAQLDVGVLNRPIVGRLVEHLDTSGFFHRADPIQAHVTGL